MSTNQVGAEVPREDQFLQRDLAGDVLFELCKNEDFTALGTLKSVQWVGLGSNLKTRDRVSKCVFLCRMLPMPVDRDVLSVLRMRKHLDESGLALAGTCRQRLKD